ncbi:MAG: phosphopentomutase, partial [Clostridia bacterium]|nr:phosphopentomutase [Clostridia bacterium]
MKRVFLIVLDSVGAGALPDAHLYGDEGAHTLKSISKSEKFSIPNLIKMGIGNIEGLSFLEKKPLISTAVARLCEKSAGKDTTTGHWEIAGVVLDKPFPTFPNGFPEEIIDEFSRRTGRNVLCNKPYSGTQVIKDYAKEHMETGSLIVYTSADSVFQIAAHEDVVSREELYSCCRIAREILTGENAVGRVIARPFNGKLPDFYRTDGRHDFSLEPPKDTLLDLIIKSGKSVVSIGKISDIFAARGISESHPTKNNDDGCKKILE